MDKLATLEILNYVLESIFLIQKRFEFINSMKILIQNEEKKNLDLSKKRGLLHSLFKLKY